MKKIFAVILVIALSISMCACSFEPQGNTSTAEENTVEKFIPVHEGEFTVIKTDWSTHQLYANTSYTNKYAAVLEYNETRILVNIGPEQYACWDTGDVISGTLKRGSEEYYVSPFPVMLNINGKDFHVSWQGE